MEEGVNIKSVRQNVPSNRKVSKSEGSTSTSHEEMSRYRSIQALYEPTNMIQEECLISFEEPTTYSKASQEEAWRKAMEEEIASINKNDTWMLVKAPKSCKPIGLKCVYKLKKNPIGEIVKHKARLVVKGYRQRYEIDYDQVFAHVACFESIHILIVLAAQKCWSLHHLDAKSAFLNGEIKVDINVTQPKGSVKEGKEEWVLNLNKALSGESFQHKDTRVPGQRRYDLRKRTNSKENQNSMVLLIQKFEKLSIHEKNEENLSKKRKERVDPRRLRFPPFPI